MPISSAIVFPLVVVGSSYTILPSFLSTFDAASFLSGAGISLTTAGITYILARLNRLPWIPFITKRPTRSNNKDNEYGAFALLRLPRQPSQWLNSGYWENVDNYHDACKALALKLAEFAKLQPGLRVEEIGFGYGESLRLWIDQFSPTHLRGITYLPSQYNVAVTKVPELEKAEATPTVELRVGDVLTKTQGWESDPVDTVLAVDAVHYVSDHPAFFRLMLEHLKPGGTLAITDYVLPLPPSQLSFSAYLKSRFMHGITAMPWPKVGFTDYASQLYEAGFEDVELLDITPSVWPKCADYIEARDNDPEFAPIRADGWNRSWSQMLTFAKMARWWGNGNLKFVMIKGKKPLST